MGDPPDPCVQYDNLKADENPDHQNDPEEKTDTYMETFAKSGSEAIPNPNRDDPVEKPDTNVKSESTVSLNEDQDVETTRLEATGSKPIPNEKSKTKTLAKHWLAKMKCVTAEDNDEESVTDLESETGCEEEDETRKKRMGQIGEVTTILSYFADYGEVLWFQGNANLYNFDKSLNQPHL